MKILITGANGLLGSNLIRKLLRKGHEIRAFVYKGEEIKTLENLKIEKSEGNILFYEDLIAASKNIDVIYHLAANTSVWPSRHKSIVEVNVEGTKNILRLAKKIKVKRLIYVGTANTFSFGTKQQPGAERSTYQGGKYRLDYMDSKYEAHQLVIRAVKEGVPAIIVNPTFMLGSYDSKPSSGQMIVAIHNNKVPGYPPGGRNYICIKDAAEGIANALTKGRIGESYIIGNENLSYKEAFGKMAKVIGVNPPKFTFPKFLVLLVGIMGSIQSKITGKKPNVSLPLARISCDDHYYSSSKAVKELNLPQTPIEVGIKESFEWLQTNKYLRHG